MNRKYVISSGPISSLPHNDASRVFIISMGPPFSKVKRPVVQHILEVVIHEADRSQFLVTAVSALFIAIYQWLTVSPGVACSAAEEILFMACKILFFRLPIQTGVVSIFDQFVRAWVSFSVLIFELAVRRFNQGFNVFLGAARGSRGLNGSQVTYGQSHTLLQYWLIYFRNHSTVKLFFCASIHLTSHIYHRSTMNMP